MKTALLSAVRLTALVATFSFVTVNASAREIPADRAAQQLAIAGTLSVTAAGPYVEIGTYQIQVLTKLGRPGTRLPDGTWLYHHRTIEGSAAEGTLVVRFARGRVSSLTMVSPAIAAALSSPKTADDEVRVATRK